MTPNRWTSAAFLALGAFLIAGATTFPEGVGRLPGAGFFPFWIGVAMVALALPLAFQRGEPAEAAPGWKLALAVAGLTFAYLLLWGTGLFAVRTAIFLALLLRMAGESWRASAGVAAGLTATVVLAFQVGLKVSLE